MKKIIAIFGTVFGILLICALGYAYSKYKAVEETVDDIQITFDDQVENTPLKADESIFFYYWGSGIVLETLVGQTPLLPLQLIRWMNQF